MEVSVDFLSVNFPGELLVAAKTDREQFQHIVMFYTLGHLYEQGKISAEYGSEILGCTRYEFYRLLTGNQFNGNHSVSLFSRHALVPVLLRTIARGRAK